MKSQFFKVPAPELLPFKSGSRRKVSWPVSHEYDGGVTVKNKWYKGYEIPPPIVPEGFVLREESRDLVLDAKPSRATGYLFKIPEGYKEVPFAQMLCLREVYLLIDYLPFISPRVEGPFAVTERLSRLKNCKAIFLVKK